MRRRRVPRHPVAWILPLVLAGCASHQDVPDGPVSLVIGTLTDAESGYGLRGSGIEFTSSEGTYRVSTTTSGSFEAALPKGEYEYVATAPCFEPAAGSLNVPTSGGLALRLVPDAAAMPGPAAAMRAGAGPTPGTITAGWDPPAVQGASPVVRYVLERGPAPGQETTRVWLGNSLAYGDLGVAPGGMHSYRVRAVNDCGNPGPPSASATGEASALPPLYLEAPVSSYATGGVSEATFPVQDAAGTVTREAAWRIVRGTGNDIELYLASTADGMLADLGGKFLHVSNDQGATWSRVENPHPELPDTGAEGAVATGPDGEVFGAGFVWAYDHIWANRYSAAEGKWYYQPVRLHEPLPDRPWLVVIKGPFQVGDAVAPFVSVFMSALWQSAGAWNAMSYDGLSYFEPTQADVESVLAQARSVSLDLGPDPDRDYMQPHQESRHAPIGHGLGLRRSTLETGCAWMATTPDATWACADTSPSVLDPSGTVAADAAGRLYNFRSKDSSFLLESSRDGGRSWTSVEQSLPAGWSIEAWDYRVSAGTDQVVVAVHANQGAADGRDQDLAYRFIDLSNGTVLKEILLLGAGDYAFGDDLFDEGQRDRFDFSSLAILPSGKIALSFADEEHRQRNGGTSLAIEL